MLYDRIYILYNLSTLVYYLAYSFYKKVANYLTFVMLIRIYINNIFEYYDKINLYCELDFQKYLDYFSFLPTYFLHV